MSEGMLSPKKFWMLMVVAVAVAFAVGLVIAARRIVPCDDVKLRSGDVLRVCHFPYGDRVELRP